MCGLCHKYVYLENKGKYGAAHPIPITAVTPLDFAMS